MSRLRRSFAFAQLVLFALPLVAQGKRPITANDLFAFHWVGDFQLSPDGKRVVFVQTTVAPTHDGYETGLYLLDLTSPAAAPVRLVAGTHDGSPRWSPDGKEIAFIRSAERDGKPSPPQLYLMAAAPSASPIRLTDLPKGVSSPSWAPDGATLVVESSTPQDQGQAKLEAAKKARATGDDAHVSDVRIINRSSYRFNGEGYLDPTFVPQLYMVYLPKADGSQDAPWQLTSGRFGVQEYTWSPATGWLFYTSTHEEEPVYDLVRHNSIYGIHPTTAAAHPKEQPPTLFTDDLTLEASGIALSPDAHHIAFHAEELRDGKPISHQQSDLLVLDLTWTNGTPSASSTLRNLTSKLSYEMGSGVGGDNTAPRGGGRPGIAWNSASNQILDVAGSRGSALLLSIDSNSGQVTELTERRQAVLGFAASPDRSTEIALVSNPIQIGDLFTVGANKQQTQLTHINDALFSQLDIRMPLDIEVTPTVHARDIDNAKIDTFIELPPDAPTEGRPAKPYPAILNIHGGPHSAYGWVFDQEMLYMAAKGYAVIYPNPRGSTTYGQQFANVIMNNYPGDDFHDLMDTVDDAVKLGYADPNRLGVTGGSGGGLLTDWVVTQTNRFKAAVAQRDIMDWAGWWYTADVGGFQQSFWPQTPPFEHVELYRAHSPITYVNNIKTPMMFILGDADYRTPPTSGGEEFFRALKYKHIPTVMVRFPRESHELSRSGEPWHRVERLENIVNWFDLYLDGICEPQYDVAPAPNATCHAGTR